MITYLAFVILLSLVGENRTNQHSRILNHHFTSGDITGAE